MSLIIDRQKLYTGVVTLMQDEPADLPPELIAEILRERWALAPSEVSYAPVGFGSCHWIAEDDEGPRWFVTANHLEPSGHWTLTTSDEIYTVLQTAASTTAALSKAGLDFVIAGLPTTAGPQVERVGDWAIEVFPYINGWSTDSGAWTDASERCAMAQTFARLHTTQPPPATPRWDPAIPHRQHLLHAVRDVNRTWTSGPYANPTRELLITHATEIHETIARHDSLVGTVEATGDEWVVTHGEPHSGNVIRATSGDLHLIDWGTVRLAPRERDLRDILTDDDGGEALAEYRRVAGPVQPNPDALALRETWWALAEISEYVRRFRRPHIGSADDAIGWEDLSHELATIRQPPP